MRRTSFQQTEKEAINFSGELEMIRRLFHFFRCRRVPGEATLFRLAGDDTTNVFHFFRCRRVPGEATLFRLAGDDTTNEFHLSGAAEFPARLPFSG